MTKEELTFYLPHQEHVDGEKNKDLNAKSSSTAKTIIIYQRNALPPIFSAILF